MPDLNWPLDAKKEMLSLLQNYNKYRRIYKMIHLDMSLKTNNTQRGIKIRYRNYTWKQEHFLRLDLYISSRGTEVVQRFGIFLKEKVASDGIANSVLPQMFIN